MMQIEGCDGKFSINLRNTKGKGPEICRNAVFIPYFVPHVLLAQNFFRIFAPQNLANETFEIMIIANKLKNTNRAEYLLYMWQVEGILRLYGCNIDRLESEYLQRFNLPAETATEMRQWYSDLCDMMRAEGKQQAGHLQICENVIIGLADLNAQLLESEKFPYYKQMYYRVLPYVVELRARRKAEESAPEAASTEEFRQLFEVLYGVMMLRLQKKEVTPETQRAAQDISALLGQLSDYWKADKVGELKLD